MFWAWLHLCVSCTGFTGDRLGILGGATPVPRRNLKEARNKVVNWTRDRVRRLARISANAALLSADLQMLIHELGPEDPGKEKLTAANEELSRAEVAIGEALQPAETLWPLIEALSKASRFEDI